ncbi:hypothetical protein GCM10018780_45730 [Streptomyces lanatus]|nr:hypothetical protein GCM10018780_45730 [Streptomyces lanatus]
MSDVQTLVDAHHYVWALDVRPQPWLDESGHEPIRRNGWADLTSPAIGDVLDDRLDPAGAGTGQAFPGPPQGVRADHRG